MILDKIKKSIQNGSIIWQKHALQRMLERGIARTEVKQAILSGDIIEDYSDDYPFPSILITNIKGTKPLHIVVAYDEIKYICYIITAYIPDDRYFEKDLLTRRDNGK